MCSGPVPGGKENRMPGARHMSKNNLLLAWLGNPSRADRRRSATPKVLVTIFRRSAEIGAFAFA
jgi:hypothetical protein